MCVYSTVVYTILQNLEMNAKPLMWLQAPSKPCIPTNHAKSLLGMNTDSSTELEKQAVAQGAKGKSGYSVNPGTSSQSRKDTVANIIMSAV